MSHDRLARKNNRLKIGVGRGGGVISCRLDRGGELIQAWQGVIQHRLGRGVVQYRLGVGVLRYRTGKGVIKLRLGRGVIRYKPLQGSDQI